METTELMIEQIIGAVAGPVSSRKQTHYLRESLRHLVRAAKSEQARDVKRCVALSIGLHAVNGTGKTRKANRQFIDMLRSGQGSLNFESHAPD